MRGFPAFPAECYQYKYPAPPSPDVAGRVQSLLREAGIPCASDARRGWDHGVFVPMMCMLPAANIPVCMLSILSNQDAQSHLALGRALEPLRSEGVLILGSGASFHNMNAFFSQGDKRAAAIHYSEQWDAWLRGALTDTSLAPEERLALLSQWAAAPGGRVAHPEGGAEHLMPLFVVCGAGAGRPGRIVGDRYRKIGFATSQFEFH
eukprot:TRINITY_DN25939_c0_g1_i2.p1 TRINITY_DN25939_c0_g1~~TRINITY_DN25939_c0_g1_i2.p1  ORF type:complete len:206 (+),score=35.02 TRINITY_DN25939_c0_g1_i2:104-721(+)